MTRGSGWPSGQPASIYPGIFVAGFYRIPVRLQIVDKPLHSVGAGIGGAGTAKPASERERGAIIPERSEASEMELDMSKAQRGSEGADGVPGKL